MIAIDAYLGGDDRPKDQEAKKPRRELLLVGGLPPRAVGSHGVSFVV